MSQELVNLPRQDLVGCETCGLVLSPPTAGSFECSRCGSRVRRYRPGASTQAVAFALSALVLYLPANMYPMLTMRTLGRETENTVWGGVHSLYQDGMWFVASIVLLARIVVPAVKLLGLFFLASAGRRWPRQSIRLYKLIRWLGPWAMLDVFLLAVAVALVKFGRFGTIIPGPGITAFAAVVVLTLLASTSFDPRSLWMESSS